MPGTDPWCRMHHLNCAGLPERAPAVKFLEQISTFLAERYPGAHCAQDGVLRTAPTL